MKRNVLVWLFQVLELKLVGVTFLDVHPTPATCRIRRYIENKCTCRRDIARGDCSRYPCECDPHHNLVQSNSRASDAL